MKLIDLLIIILAILFFHAVFEKIAQRQDEKHASELEGRAFDDAEILSHEIRQSGLIGLNLNGNPEL